MLLTGWSAICGADLGARSASTIRFPTEWTLSGAVPPGRTVVCGHSGSLTLWADIRRADFLQLCTTEPGQCGELAVLADGWRELGTSLFDRVRGPGAMAIHDGDRGTLLVWRSPMSNRPVFYREERGGVAIAGSISALHREGDTFDPDYIGAGVSWSWTEVGATPFREIRLVPPGRLARWNGGLPTFDRAWQPGRVSTIDRSLAETGKMVRAALDRAVDRCLEGTRGRPIATQLSAGRDSSAVSASAARLSGARDVVALTAAPAEGYDGPAEGDEAGIAGRTADALGLDHEVVRADGEGLADRLDRLTALAGEPVGNMPALNWWDALTAAAARRDAALMLTGTLGNYSVSAGGLAALPSLLRDGKVGAFLDGVRQRRRDAGMGTVLAHIFPGLASSRAGQWLRRRFRPAPWPAEPRFVRGDLARWARDARSERKRPSGIPDEYRARLAFLLDRADLGDLPVIRSHGVDLADPTADRDLIELCLSVPDEVLAIGPSPRPLFASAFGQRVPAEVVDATVRGRQGEDWYRQFPPLEVERALSRYEHSPHVRRWIDLAEMRSMMRQWPLGHEEAVEVENDGMDFLNALSMAAFLYWADSTTPS